MNYRKHLCIVLMLVATLFLSTQVIAHPPENIDLDYSISTQVLTVSITHITTNPNSHYVSKVQIYKNNVNIIEREYSSQPTQNTFTLTFTFQASIGDIIKVEAEDNLGFKTEETINVTDDYQNSPPTIPVIQGQTNGKAGTLYEYSFSSTDTNGDNIFYCVQWGDNSGEICLGPFPSGSEQNASHIWSGEGSYIIKIKARDIKGAESNWATLEVSMPKTHIYNPIMQLILKLLERFPF